MNWLINEVLAQGGGVALLEPSVLGTTATTSAGYSFVSYMSRLTTIFFTLVIVGAVIMITIGGIQYMFGKTPGGESEAKDRIWGAIWGLLLALAAILILNTINPELTIFKMFQEDPPATPANSQPTGNNFGQGGQFGGTGGGATW